MSAENMKTISRYFCATALVIAGLVGLYLKIEYSGWALAVGLFIAA